MYMDFAKELSLQFNCDEKYVTNIITLLDEGNTIPFIARYRKELHGSMDDQKIREIAEQLEYLRALEARREEVRELIAAQEKLTDEINEALNKAKTLAEINDIYLPFRPKRKTKASVARARGLEPLADLIFAQTETTDPLEMAESYVNPELEVETREAALEGALHIIAENISDVAEYRKELRDFAFSFGVITTKQAKDEDSVYADYYDYREEIKKLRPHRVLAITRGEREEFLRVSLELDRDTALSKISSHVITNPKSPVCEFISRALADSYDRLIFPSVEREVRSELFDNASEGALKVFSDNLRKLLLAAPLKGKTVLGYDPGYRTGCKLAVVDKTGKVLDTAVIYPTKPREETEKSRKVVANLIKKYGVDVIAIGNGTASRESEQFIADSIHELGFDTKYTIVSEAGASVYSASKLGAEEFPDFDVTERSAVSIARRLQDPLAELVKIDPKAIGVGQYQHDMKQARLTEALDGVVEDCVNSVGVDINTASHSLLSHISGINATAAKNIVTYREENGEFTSRAQILKVPKIGAKAFEQCAGFLRVSGSNEILDNTGVHPESYAIAKSLLSTFGYTEEDVKSGNISALRAKATIRGTAKLSEELGCGEPTLLDIIGELEKPGRDIRDSLPPPCLRTDVLDIKDLKPDMLLKGTVRNVVDFGAFVDIGVHYDGLLHISEMSDKYIKHPSEMVSVGDVIEVRIKSVDLTKNRIALSCKNMVVVE